MTEVVQVNIFQPVLETLSQEQGQMVVAGGVKTRLEWGHGLQVLSHTTFPSHTDKQYGDLWRLSLAVWGRGSTEMG